MANKYLKVYVKDELAGYLYSEPNNMLSFSYVDGYSGLPVSINMSNLSKKYLNEDVYPFFENLLSEGQLRDETAKYFGANAESVFQMLALTGKECSGVVSLYKPEEEYVMKERASLEKVFNENKPLNDDELTDLIKRLEEGEFDASELKRESEVAGVQNKYSIIFLEHKGEELFFKDIKNSPTNAILKVNKSNMPSLIYNEYYCMILARKIGLDTAPVYLFSKGKRQNSFMVVIRYDRLAEAENNQKFLSRLSQEDFCQVLAVPSSFKYENNAKKDKSVSIKKIYDFLEGTDKIRFIDSVIFNYIIGNNDAHGKNYSIVESDEKPFELAPLYDIHSSQVYTKDYKKMKMSMSINKKYFHHEIVFRDFIKLAEYLNLNPKFIETRIEKVIKKIKRYNVELRDVLMADPVEQDAVYDKIIEVINKNIKNLEDTCKMYYGEY